MVVLKIIGVCLAVVLAFFALFCLLLACRIRVELKFDTADRVECFIKFLLFKIDILKKKDKKKGKKKSVISEYLKRALGLDILENSDAVKDGAESGGVSDKVTKVITALSFLAGEIGWLIKRFKINRLKLIAVCAGEDAADAAIEYGLVCAAVYPMLGYIDTNLKIKKNAKNIQIGCDFNGNARFCMEFGVSVRIIHILRALYRSASANAERLEEAKQ